MYVQTVSQDQEKSIVGVYQTLAQAAEGNDILPIAGLKKTLRYQMQTKSQRVFLHRFGGLINHLLPFSINPNGFLFRWADRLYAMQDCVETYQATGQVLMQGVHLNNQFVGTGYNERVRLLGDFGSNLYTIEAIPSEQK